MLRKVLAFAALAVLTGAAAAPPAKAPAPKAAAAKAPAAKAPPAKAAPAPKAAGGAAFDARDPAALIAILNGAGAKAQAGRRVEDAVQLVVSSTAANFTVLFVGCNPQGKACRAAVYEESFPPGPTLDQINAFNQSSALCKAYRDKPGRSQLVYSTLVFPNMTREQVMTQLEAWQNCIGNFTAFARDPVGYLAEAP